MNKYQDALDYLISNGTHTTEYSWEDEIEVETERGEESVNLLQELVDKETPMKKTIKKGRPYCAKCSYSLLIEDVWEMSYCCACGQKVDWGSRDE